MSMDTSQLPFGKGVTRATLKARDDRAEAKQVKAVRVQCVDRDGYCRLHWVPIADRAPGGPSEWAHLGDKRRARTRGMAPEIRHTTADSLMMCRSHHAAYDAGEFTIEPETDRGADGYLRVRVLQREVNELRRRQA